MAGLSCDLKKRLLQVKPFIKQVALTHLEGINLTFKDSQLKLSTFQLIFEFLVHAQSQDVLFSDIY